jgi:hypothetical protein
MIATGTIHERLSALAVELQALQEALERATGDDDPALELLTGRVTRCTIGMAEIEREIQDKLNG